MTNTPLPVDPTTTGTSPAVPYAYLRRRQVEKVVGLSRTTIYRLIGLGKFPPPMRLGANSVAWHSGDINSWIESRQPSIVVE
jgi:prophage regulatory protein